MNDDGANAFYIDAIEHEESGTLVYGMKKMDKQIIIDYFDRLIDIVGYSEDGVQEMLARLTPDELNTCLKKVGTSNTEIGISQLFTLWYNIDDDTKRANKEFVYKTMMQCAKLHQGGMLFADVLGFVNEEDKPAVCKEIIKLLEPIDRCTYALIEGFDAKIIIESLKQLPDLPQYRVMEVWTKLNISDKDSAIFELIDTYDKGEIKQALWYYYKNNSDRLLEATQRYKGNETLENIIYATDTKSIKSNIIEILESNKDDINSLLYIWGGINKKKMNFPDNDRYKEDRDFVYETEDKLFNNLLPLINNNPEQMIYAWKIDPKKLNERIPNFFYDIYEKVKDNNELLIKLWMQTSEDMQPVYKDIYLNVVNAARENKELLEEIWKKTEETVKNDNELVLAKIIELESDNIDRIAEIWKSSPQMARVKSFKEVCKKMHTDTKLNDDELENINEAFLAAYHENTDVTSLLPTEFMKFYSSKNIEALGDEKLIQLACYPEIVKKINSLNNKQVQTIGLCCDRFMKKYETSEWIYIFKDIVENIQDFDELINSKETFTEEELDKLNVVLSDANVFEIKDTNELMNIDQIRKEECDHLIKAWRNTDKIDAICISKFGYSRKKLEKLLDTYGRDYDKFEDSNLKYFIGSLEMLLHMLYEGEQLQKIYDEVEPVSEFNLRAVERQIKNEYAKMYDKTLFQVSDAIPNPELGENIYELPVDENGKIKEFNMIMTAIGAFNYRNINNYYEDWNQNSRASQHFCASYINKYMLGHANINGICFGFSSLEKDSLVLLGPEDIGSSSREGISEANRRERYMEPDRLLDETRNYSEIDIYRTNNGERKQPDFILCFRKNGKIKNLEESKNTSKEFEEACGTPLPIVIIDEDKIQEESIESIRQLLEEYDNNPSKETRDMLIKIVRRSGEYNQEISRIAFTSSAERELYNRIYWEKDAETGSWSNLNVIKQRMNDMHDAVREEEEKKGYKKMHDEIYEQVDKEDR